MQDFSDDEDNNDDEIRLAVSTSSAPHQHDVIVGASASSTKRLLQKVSITPMTSSPSYGDECEVLQDIDDDNDNYEDDDEDSVNNDKNLGEVGFKWRIRVLRVNDSEEQWKGVCEIYFHWCVDNASTSDRSSGLKKRRKKKLTEKEKHAIVNIDQPEKCPIFVILNEEDSNSIEEMYYTMPGYPEVMFGYLAWTVIVHERLELERYPFDRQFFKLEIECTNGHLIPWTYPHVPSLVIGRIEVGNVKCHFFAVSDTPSWQLDVLNVTKGNRDSVLIMNIGMTRLTGFYISNISLPYFLIGTAAVLTTAIDPDDYSNRFESMIALYLTLVAIKFVASFLPVISYSTLLDYYTLIAYFFLAGWMIENFAMSPLFWNSEDKHLVHKIDIMCAYIYIFLWVSLHCLIMLGSYCDLFRKSWYEVENDDQEVDPTTHKEVFDVLSEDSDEEGDVNAGAL